MQPIFRLACLVPWLSLNTRAQPLLPGTGFLDPAKTTVPDGQCACRVRNGRIYFLGDDGRVRIYRDLRAAPVVVDVGQGAQELAVAEVLVVTYPEQNLVRVFSLLGETLAQYSCPEPRAVALVDLDADGKSEIVVASENGLRLFGKSAEVKLSVGRVPVALAAVDLNGDGRPDLAVACLGDCQTKILTNLGGLKFHSQPPIPSDYPVSLVSGDLDGDGKNELVSSDRARGTVTVHGSRRVDLDLKQAVGQVELADLNGDQNLDLVVLAPEAGVFYLLNRGDLNFSAPELLGRGTTRWAAVREGDLLMGGLSQVDLIEQAAAPLRGPLKFFAGTLVNLGNGSILAAERDGAALLGPSLALRPVSLEFKSDYTGMAGNLRGSGVSDLVAPGKPWVVHANLGQDRFGPAENLPFEGSHGAVADFDGNGRDEIVIFLDRENRAVHLADDAAHTLKASIPVRDTIWEAIATDFDCDGRVDVLFSTSLRSDYFLLRNTPQGLSAPQPIACPSYHWSGTLNAVADLNGDKLADLVYFDHGEVTVLANLSKGSNLRIDKPRTVNMKDESFETKRSSGHGDEGMLLDVNGDGQPDLVDLDFYRDRVGIRLNTTTNRQFRWGGLRTYPTGAGPRRVTAQDLNGDGLPDLIIANEGSKDLSVWLNHTKPGSSLPDFGH